MLRASLQTALAIPQPAAWGNLHAMKEARKSVEQAFGGPVAPPGVDQLQAALKRFARSSRITSFTELKYVCYGATLPVDRDQWRLIDHQPLFDALLGAVRQYQRQPKVVSHSVV